MIKSMTGFGCCEVTESTYQVTVEMKSVNHRYLDIAIKMPKKLYSFENAIRNLLKDYVQRGKVDVYINYEDFTENQINLKYNHGLAEEYVKYIRQAADEFSIPFALDACELSKRPEVITMEARTLDEKELWKVLERAVTGAAGQFVESRVQEGEKLRNDLYGKLDAMSGYVGQIEKRSPEILSEYRQKLTDKVNELLAGAQADESRILTEVTLFADRICTDEETVRLKSHIASTKDTLAMGGSVGRKLDFIAQEMNREANTILSKANDLTVSDIAINLKTDIEKVLPYIDDFEYCIGKNTIEKAFWLFRYVCVKVYNDDLWGGYSLSWKVKQISKVSKGDNIAEYRPKQGSTIYVKASQDGTLFQFKVEKGYSCGSVGVISHPSDSGKKIEQWLTKKYEGENVTFEFIDESNRFW